MPRHHRHHLLTAATIAALVAPMLGCSGKPPNANDPEKPQRSDMTPLATCLAPAKDEAKRYLFIEALPSHASCAPLVSQATPEALASLPPLSLFFAIQMAPTKAAGLSPDALTHAYLEAIRWLPITWWGMPDGLDTPASQNLLAAPLSQRLFAAAIDDATPLQGSESEDNTIAVKLGWTAGDYVHAFLARYFQIDAVMYAMPDVRRTAKQRTKALAELAAGIAKTPPPAAAEALIGKWYRNEAGLERTPGSSATAKRTPHGTARTYWVALLPDGGLTYNAASGAGGELFSVGAWRVEGDVLTLTLLGREVPVGEDALTTQRYQVRPDDAQRLAPLVQPADGDASMPAAEPSSFAMSYDVGNAGFRGKTIFEIDDRRAHVSFTRAGTTKTYEGLLTEAEQAALIGLSRQLGAPAPTITPKPGDVQIKLSYRIAGVTQSRTLWQSQVYAAPDMRALVEKIQAIAKRLSRGEVTY